MNLTGKVALITGGASGIGEAITTCLAEAGADVVINYHHSKDKALALQAKLVAQGRNCLVLQGNVAIFDEAKALVEGTLSEFGKIDILVNNAGITKDQLLLRMSENDFDEVIATNLKGTWNMIKAATSPMSKARSGRIINISSIAGVIGNPGQSNYAASKAGMIGLTKSVAREFSKRNMTANAIAPGFIETQMTAALPAEVQEKYLAQIPIPRYGKPEDVAHLVVFLASDLASYITGQVIHVDGGLVMN